MTDLPAGTVAMLAAHELDGALLRSLTAEFARRGTVHHTEATTFNSVEGPVRAVRWSVSMADSDDNFGTQLLESLLEDAAATLDQGRKPTTTVLPAHQRPAAPRMLIMDVDSTLIDQEVIDLLAAHAGREDDVAQVTERAMRGELDFAESLHARVAALAGLPETTLQDTYRSVRPTLGAAELIELFRTRGEPVFAVSGGFVQILEPLAQQLGLTSYAANDLQLAEGRLTGRVEGAVVDRAVKRRRMEQWAAAYGIDAHNVVAVGDGANDLDMVTSAGVGVAFCAKPALADRADLSIRHRNLQLVSFALGFGLTAEDE